MSPRATDLRHGPLAPCHDPLSPALGSPAGAGLAAGAAEIAKAAAMAAGTPREQALIAALGIYDAGAETIAPAERALRYSDAIAEVARRYPGDDEVAVFYALSLLAAASPADRSHARRKRAADILEPIWKREPEHPGAPHYLIHAYDSAALAARGLSAARACRPDRAGGASRPAHAVAHLHGGTAAPGLFKIGGALRLTVRRLGGSRRLVP